MKLTDRYAERREHSDSQVVVVSHEFGGLLFDPLGHEDVHVEKPVDAVLEASLRARVQLRRRLVHARIPALLVQLVHHGLTQKQGTCVHLTVSTST